MGLKTPPNFPFSKGGAGVTLVQGSEDKNNVKGSVMLSAAKHLIPERDSSPEAQNDTGR